MQTPLTSPLFSFFFFWQTYFEFLSSKMRILACILLCFLLTYNPTIGQYNEVFEVVKYLLTNHNVKEVISIIRNLTQVPESEKEKMIKQVEIYGNVHKVGGFYDVVVQANSLKG